MCKLEYWASFSEFTLPAHFMHGEGIFNVHVDKTFKLRLSDARNMQFDCLHFKHIWANKAIIEI
jgi:hypothetical protein